MAVTLALLTLGLVNVVSRATSQEVEDGVLWVERAVGVVAAEGKVQIRGVKLGRDFGQTVEILAGVGPTDKVILNPGDSLHDGMAVRVAEAAQAGAAKSGKKQ